MSSCKFCDLANGLEVTHVVYETSHICCFLDIDPISEGHTLIVPKKHILDIEESNETLRLEIMNASALLSVALKKIYTPDGISIMQNGGFFNDVNHYHMHVFARYKEDGFGWINPKVKSHTHMPQNKIADRLNNVITQIFKGS
jgi:histidine triad (HIT) family protein